jgi:predicted CopG family antitoxin
MHNARVSTKTISLKREAYERLKAARRYPDESFSEVVLRATWPEDTLTARELLQVFRHGQPHLPERVLDRVDALKRRDAPPENKWSGR